MKFCNKENTLYRVTDENLRRKIIWDSRSVAIIGVIGFNLTKNNELYFPIQKRNNTVSHSNKYCLPCGYLDWDEDAYDAFRREVYEETGINIDLYENTLNNKQPNFIDTDPNNFNQNVCLVYLRIYNCDKLPKLIVSNESLENKWFNINDVHIHSNDFAFGHDKLINKLHNIYESKNKEHLNNNLINDKLYNL